MSDDDTTTPESANADTQPDARDPGRSAADDAPDSAQPPDSGASTRPDGSGPEASGVMIPTWLAGALVVVLALVVAGAGFAIGRATAPDDDGFRPVVATEDGGGARTLPIPGGGGGDGRGGGPGGLPGFPNGPQGRGGEGPRGIPGERDRTFPDDEDSGDEDPGDEDSDDEPGDDDSEVPAPPELPGT